MSNAIQVPARPVLPDGHEFRSMRTLTGYRLEECAVIGGIARSTIQAFEAGRTPTRGHAILGLAKCYRRFCAEAGR